MREVILFIALVACVGCSSVSAKRAVFRADLERLISRYREHVLPSLEGVERDRDAVVLAEIEVLIELTSLVPIKDE